MGEVVPGHLVEPALHVDGYPRDLLQGCIASLA